jgi:hypothetical protein
MHMDPKFSRSHFVKSSFGSRLNQVLACLYLTSHLWRYCFTDNCIFDLILLRMEVSQSSMSQWLISLIENLNDMP